MIHTYDNEGMFSPSLTHYSQSYRTLLRFARSTAFSLPPTGKKSSLYRASASIPYRSISGKYPCHPHPSRNKYRKLPYPYRKSDWIRHYRPVLCVREGTHSVYYSFRDLQGHYSADRVQYACHHTHYSHGYRS